MTTDQSFNIAVMPGDGIGQEIMPVCLDILAVVESRVGGYDLSFTQAPAGAQVYLDTGTAFPQSSHQVAERADAILLGAMGLPSVRYQDGTEITPQLDLRFDLDLYAGVRPVRAIPGTPSPLSDARGQAIDFVLIRESTEGLFASHGKGTVDDERATDTMVITRKTCERLFDFAFTLARRRKAEGTRGCVTCVDKANIFASMAFFRGVFNERAALNGDLDADYAYVDAMALNMIRRPWDYDVLVTENMFGDILSDLGAGLIGGMGMAPSADIGDDNAVFQPCHGSAPDIMGTGKANPTAMILSAAMMLDWLGHRSGHIPCIKAGALLNAAVDVAFAGGGLVPVELGGADGTANIANAVRACVESLEIPETS